MPVAEELVAAFGLATAGAGPVLAPVARGAMGAIWRLDTSNRSYAAKQLFFDPPDPHRVAAEIALVDRAGPRASSARSPLPHPMAGTS